MDFEKLSLADKIFYIVPMYCGNPSALYFIPASNEPSAVLARAYGECREGRIPRSSAALQD